MPAISLRGPPVSQPVPDPFVEWLHLVSNDPGDLPRVYTTTPTFVIELPIMSTWSAESQERESMSFLFSVYMQVDSFAVVGASIGR